MIHGDCLPDQRRVDYRHSQLGRRVREIIDEGGRRWDVVVGKESWGTLVVLFSPRNEGDPRKSILRAETPLDAERELADMSEEELLTRLTTSEPWR